MIVDTVRGFLESHEISGPVLVATSGGADSTALLLSFVELGTVEFAAAHVNHHLRGAESDEDEAFIRDLCARLGIRLHVADGTLDPDAVRTGGVETAARDIRYRKLKEIGARWIATAHHKNDQAETVLMRLMTGGGIAGLRGIHPIRSDGVIRPLLDVTRADIDAFLRERSITPRSDSSNDDPRFLRNRVRKALAGFDAVAIDSLASIARQARDQWAMLEQAIDRIDTKSVTADETRFSSWPGDPWLRRALLHRHIRRLDPQARDVSAADLDRLAREMETVKRVSVTASLELLRRGEEWILRKRPRATPQFELEIRPGQTVRIPEIGARIHLDCGGKAAAFEGKFQLPPSAEPTFTIRNRRNGDRFQPLGMSGEKKLKDFLIDRKIDAEVRDRIPLVVWNGRIVCVGGVEVSEAFKVKDGPGELYEVSIEEEESQKGV